MAKRIIACMPRHLCYVEPFFGGGSVLLARDPDDEQLMLAPHKGVSEVINDIDHNLMTFWQVIADPELFQDFQRRVDGVPLSQPHWEEARAKIGAQGWRDKVEQALCFFIFARQSLAGRIGSFTPMTRARTRRSMNGNVSEWLGAVEGLPAVHQRLRRVAIFCEDALQVIRREDSPGNLFYCDPPYMHGTRTATQVYAHEYTDQQHRQLLALLRVIKGKFLLSAYRSPLYDKIAKQAGWHCRMFTVPNQAAAGASKRLMTECLYANFKMPEIE